MFANTNELDERLGGLMQASMFPNLRQSFDVKSKDRFISNTAFDTPNESILETFHVVDSAIVTSEDGSQMYHYYTHNSNGSKTSEVSQDLIGTSRVNNSRNTYDYDINGNIVSSLSEIWDDLTWLNVGLHTYSYDSSGVIDTVLSGWWQDSSWVNSSRHTYESDSSGNITSLLLEQWDGSELTNATLTTFEHDTNGNTTFALIAMWSDSTWLNNSHYTYTYNIHGNQTHELHEVWDGSEWVNAYQTSKDYDSNENLVLRLYDRWSVDSTWERLTRNTYSYSPGGHRISVLSEGWDGAGWFNRYLRNYGYDDNGNVTLVTCETWLDESWVLDNSPFIIWGEFGNYYQYYGAEAELFYTATTTDIEYYEVNVSEFSLSQNFPNPFNPSTTLLYNLSEQVDVTLTVYDITGRTVAILVNQTRLAGHYEAHWNGMDEMGKPVSSGMYFAKLQAGQYTSIVKMVYLR